VSIDITKLEPKEVWSHFDKIRQIPRCSKNEKAIGDYVIEVAKRNNLEWKRDEVGNIVVRKPAIGNKKDSAGLILQCHLDMVCEKNSDVVHDFSKDPLKLRIDGDYLMAVGTTLGSDNGIGIANALAVMESKDLSHPPIEFLFTVDEETGLTGANNLKKDFLTYKRLINLDSEEDGAIYIGCAGGADSTIRMKIKYDKLPKDFISLRIKVSGLKGGHSGTDIHEERGNAIKILSRVLFKLMQNVKLSLIHIKGGNKRNAIPREAEAIIAINKNAYESCEKIVKDLENSLKIEYEKKDKDLKIEIEETTNPLKNNGIIPRLSKKIINLLYALPHGVLAMSADIKGLVETSTNLAIVNLEKGQLIIGINSRSSVDSALKAALDRMKAFADLASAKIEFSSFYPGWKPNPDSNLLKLAKKVYKELFNKEPEVKAIHAGLECGIIGEKYPNMDMISVGPQIENPHSPSERVQISTVSKFWNYLKALLAQST